MVGIDVNPQQLIDAMNEAAILEEGYLYTISPGGYITTHPNEAVLLEDFRTTWLGAYTEEIESIVAKGGAEDGNTDSCRL